MTDWPMPEDDPADVAIEQLERDVELLKAENAQLRRALASAWPDEIETDEE